VRIVYAILISLFGLVCIIFNRTWVEVAYSYRGLYVWFRPPVIVARAIVVLSGLFLVAFGLMFVMGFWQ
jgi:hypothetical protein